jgi:hypothetical protein
MWTSNGDNAAAENQLADQKNVFPMERFHGTDDLYRSSEVQGFLRVFGQVRPDMCVDCALWSGDQQVRSSRTAGDTLGHHLLDRAGESSFVRHVVAETKAPSTWAPSGIANVANNRTLSSPAKTRAGVVNRRGCMVSLLHAVRG